MNYDNNCSLSSSQGSTCCRTCRVRRGAVTPCLPVQTTASSSRQEVSTAASTRSTPSTWTHDDSSQSRCSPRVLEAWRQTITTTTYCIFKAEAVRFVLILNRCEKYVSGSFDGTNQSAKLTKCRAAGKLSNMKGQSGNLVKL